MYSKLLRCGGTFKMSKTFEMKFGVGHFCFKILNYDVPFLENVTLLIFLVDDH